MGETEGKDPQMKSFKDLREKTLTPAEKKKREEIAKAMERDNPGMDMGKKMAIATATAKKVTEETQPDQIELDEKVYASDYNVGHEKSQFGGYRPHVTHKKTGKTMYLGSTSYKTPKHAKGHAAAYLNGYEKINDKHADRKAREYATQNKQHQYVKESTELEERNLKRMFTRPKAYKVELHGKPTQKVMAKSPEDAGRQAQNRFPHGEDEKYKPKVKSVSIHDSKNHVHEISLDMLTKKISNTGMAATKKANKMDKTKKDLAAMRARLAGKPALAKEEVQSADKKPEKFIKPDGTVGIRMVRTDKKVVDKDA